MRACVWGALQLLSIVDAVNPLPRIACEFVQAK